MNTKINKINKVVNPILKELSNKIFELDLFKYSENDNSIIQIVHKAYDGYIPFTDGGLRLVIKSPIYNFIDMGLIPAQSKFGLKLNEIKEFAENNDIDIIESTLDIIINVKFYKKDTYHNPTKNYPNPIDCIQIDCFIELDNLSIFNDIEGSIVDATKVDDSFKNELNQKILDLFNFINRVLFS